MTSSTFHFARSALRAISICVIAWMMFSPPAASADERPRYKFKAGQELTYRLETPQIEWDDKQGGKITSHSSTQTWNIYVVRENDDGTWRLVYTNRWRSAAPGSTDVLRDGYFDLRPDGEIADGGTLDPGIWDASVIFPPLPPDAEHSADWQSTSPIDGAVRKLTFLDKADSDDAVHCRLGETTESLINSVYEITERREYVFDRGKGLVQSGSIDVEQRFARSAYNITMRLELISTSQIANEERDRLDGEFARYVAADREYRKLIDRALYHDFNDAAKLLDEAESLLKQLAAQLETPLAKAMLENKLKTHAQGSESYLRDAAASARLVGKPSPDWKTTDLDGNSHTVADYRGKVVLLEFWDRGCGWCIRSMPQINQLVDDFRGQNVAILGMNCDEDEQDAHFVIEKARLTFPTLKDHEQRIRRGWGAQASYPTTIILDAQGVVRHYHTGYSPTLRQEFGDVIRRLLAGD